MSKINCPECHCISIELDLSKPDENGFTIKYNKCVNCGYVMSVDDMEKHIKSIDEQR